MRKLKQLFVLMMLVSVLSVSVVPAFAASPSPKPGNGFGDPNHVHTGPPGQSDRQDEHVKASVSIIIAAEGGVHAVIDTLTGLLHSIHFG